MIRGVKPFAYALAAAVYCAGMAANAAIFRIDFEGPTTGTPDPAAGAFILEFNPDEDTPWTTDGVLFSEVNFILDGGVAFDYRAFGQLVIGTDVSPGSVSRFDNDFFLNIVGFNTLSPTVSAFTVSQSDQGFIAINRDDVTLTITELDDYPVSEVPVPGALALMMTGLAGLGLMRKRNTKTPTP